MGRTRTSRSRRQRQPSRLLPSHHLYLPPPSPPIIKTNHVVVAGAGELPQRQCDQRETILPAQGPGPAPKAPLPRQTARGKLPRRGGAATAGHEQPPPAGPWAARGLWRALLSRGGRASPPRGTGRERTKRASKFTPRWLPTPASAAAARDEPWGWPALGPHERSPQRTHARNLGSRPEPSLPACISRTQDWRFWSLVL